MLELQVPLQNTRNQTFVVVLGLELSLQIPVWVFDVRTLVLPSQVLCEFAKVVPTVPENMSGLELEEAVEGVPAMLVVN